MHVISKTRTVAPVVVLLTVAAGLLLAGRAQSQGEVDFIWIQQFGSEVSEVEPLAIDVYAAGIYIAGLGGGLPSQDTMGDGGAFVRRYDHNGNEVWTRHFGGIVHTWANGIAAGPAGVYVAGRTDADLGGQLGGEDAYVRKYDHNGNHIWTRQFGTEMSDEAWGIAIDDSGVYVAGRTSGQLPGQTSTGSSDGFVRKYDHDDNEVWTSQFGSFEFEEPYAVAVHAEGIYVSGYTDDILPGATGDPSGGFLRKYNHAGNHVWTRQMGGADHWAVVAHDSGVYVGGNVIGSGGVNDAYVRKYGHNGSTAWTRQVSFGTVDRTFGLAADEEGIYMAGVTGGFGQPGAFVRRYTHAGAEEWTFRFGTQDERLTGIATGSAYVIGRTFGALPGQTSTSSKDGFLVKIGDPAATPAPTPQPTPTPAPTPTPPPGAIQGDVDCNDIVNAVDALLILRDVAGLPHSADCLDLAGDVNCDGATNAIDSLGILRYVAALPPLPAPGDCPPVGDPL